MANKSHVLVFIIFTFSFLYRLLLMFWQGYPPGADIGLHNSVIYSITGAGNTDFLYNYYHIGGGISLTFPGYHIFTAAVMMMTGMSGAMEYVAQALVVAMFSSLTVLCGFLITRRVWAESAALVVAFLMAISRFDIEMILWAGYPNVVALFLIPLTFYLFIQRERFSKIPFLISASILSGALFLTHSLSAAVFGAMTVFVVLLVMVSPKSFGSTRKNMLYWILPIILGVILVSPFLVNAVPAYFSQNASLADTAGSSDITSATLSTRILPLEIVLPLFGVVAAFFAFSKKFYKRFLSLPSFLLAMWVFVPLILTQGYLVGFYVDYNRFLYFLILPVMIFIAVLIDYGSGFFAKIVDEYRKPKGHPQLAGNVKNKRIMHLAASLIPSHKTVYSIFILFFLLFAFVSMPIFMGPTLNCGEVIQSYYQTMNGPLWDGIQWAKENTPLGSVFVSDALYGWWFGGFSQRPTLSAVEPEYLTVKREVDNATFARNILETDYFIDNSYTLVRDDGGYIARHNPEVLVKQNWTYYPYSFFRFNSEDTVIDYRVNGVIQPPAVVSELEVKDMHLERYQDREVIVITQGNEYFNYTRFTTVYGGQVFSSLTLELTSLVPDVSFDRVDVGIETNGVQIPYDNMVTVALVEKGTKSFGQLIFNTLPNSTKLITPYKSDVVVQVQLKYLLGGSSEGTIMISSGAYSADNNPNYYTNQEALNAFFAPIVKDNLNSSKTPINSSFDDFEYSTVILNRSISFIACRYPDVDAKFRNDPLFSLVFINEEVAIFKVNGNLK